MGTEGPGPLLPTWETWVEFLGPDFSLAQFQVLRSGPVHRSSTYQINNMKRGALKASIAHSRSISHPWAWSKRCRCFADSPTWSHLLAKISAFLLEVGTELLTTDSRKRNVIHAQGGAVSDYRELYIFSNLSTIEVDRGDTCRTGTWVLQKLEWML